MHYFKRNAQKICFFCRSKSVKKNGKVVSIQLYKCKDCGKQFRGVKRLDIDQFSDDYVFGCQSVNRLATKYKVSQSTIRRRLDSLRSTHIVKAAEQANYAIIKLILTPKKLGVSSMRNTITRKITENTNLQGVIVLDKNGKLLYEQRR